MTLWYFVCGFVFVLVFGCDLWCVHLLRCTNRGFVCGFWVCGFVLFGCFVVCFNFVGLVGFGCFLFFAFLVFLLPFGLWCLWFARLFSSCGFVAMLFACACILV